MDPQIVVDRLVRLARFDTTVFEEFRDDPGATVASIIIAAISFFLAGLGGWFWWLIQDYGDKGKAFWQSTLLGTVLGIGLWLIWILVTYAILVYLFHYTADIERMVRACGIATIPLALCLLMWIPGVNLGVGLAAFALTLLLTDIGVQVSVDAQPGHVILATFAGFLVFTAILSLLTQRDTWLAPGIFLFRPPASALSDVSKGFNVLR